MVANPGSGCPPSLLERGIVFALIFLTTGALMPLLRLGGGATPNDAAAQIQVAGDPVQQRVWLLSFVVIAGLVLRHLRSVLRVGLRTTLPWSLTGLALLSTAWSAAPPLTLRRAVLLFGMTSFGAYLAARFPGAALVRLLGAVLAAIALLSVAFALVLPAYGLEHGIHAGLWRGIFAQKNVLGQVMAFGATIWLLRVLYGDGRRFLNLVFLTLSVTLVILAGSSTALVLLVTVGTLLTGFRMLQFGAGVVGLVLVGTGTAVPAAAVWLLVNYERLLALLGRDPTLTGRTEYWALARLMIERRPLLGYGYAGFWQGGREGPASDFILALGGNPTHAHNGILDLWLTLGLVGVVVFVGSLGLNLLRALAHMGHWDGIAGAFPLAFLLFLIASNVTESDVMTYNSLAWLLFAAISFQVPAFGRVSVQPVSAAANPVDRQGIGPAFVPRVTGASPG